MAAANLTSPECAEAAEAVLIRHILAPVDVAAPNRAATEMAVTLARKMGARLTFLHVLTPVTADIQIVAAWGDFPEQRRALAAKELRLWTDQWAADTERNLEVREGRPFEMICQWASDAAVDLIVLAREDRQGMIRQPLGSTAERVVRHAPCSVLVLDGSSGESCREGGPVVVTTDFSEASAAAVEWARVAAALAEGSLTVVHVEEPLGLPGTREYAWHEEQIEALRQEADERLTGWRRQHFGPASEVETMVVEGTPYRAICRTAERLRASAIIMARHGSAGWVDNLMGHITERVARRATCPVLVVRKRGPAEAPPANDLPEATPK